jgi:aminopeptidase-like protein
MSHPLAVIAYSAPFRGQVDLTELKRHLHFDARFDDALPFHFRQTYRAWDRKWGFCVPKRLYDALGEGTYDVNIETRESAAPLRVLEYVHPGVLDTAVVIGGNFDHPGVANDGAAGCVVGMELFRWLSGRQTKFTYVLALVPGIIGSEYYLARMPASRRANFLEGVFLEMLGSNGELAYQRSREGRSGLDALIPAVLSASSAKHRVAAYPQIILNDEYIWEAYDIPMSSLSRFPYPEYHSSRDDMSIVSEQSLTESVSVLQRAIDELESTPLVRKRFEGTICLSNPRYDLYVDPGQAAFGDVPEEQRRRLRRLMDELPTLRRPITVAGLAANVGLDTGTARAYLEKWSARGLVTLD